MVPINVKFQWIQAVGSMPFCANCKQFGEHIDHFVKFQDLIILIKYRNYFLLILLTFWWSASSCPSPIVHKCSILSSNSKLFPALPLMDSSVQAIVHLKCVCWECSNPYLSIGMHYIEDNKGRSGNEHPTNCLNLFM